MRNEIQNIVVHSTQTLPYELTNDLPFNYVIHRNGRIVKSKQLKQDDLVVKVAFVGGIDTERKISDSRTEEQNETLFNTLFLLSEKYPLAKIAGADELFGESYYPGFNVKEWLKSYIPKSLNQAI
jgi:hypothetical protein